MTFVKHGSVTEGSVSNPMLALVLSRTLFALNVSEVSGNMEAVSSSAAFVEDFCAKTINSSTRQVVKFWSPKTTSASLVTVWASTPV